MINQNNSIEYIELVFKNSYEIKPNKLTLDCIKMYIFEHDFWENTFLMWINILLNEFNQFLPNYLLDKKSGSLSFEIVDDLKISDLNKIWLNKSGPTDVLSFPILSKEDSINDLNSIEFGDIFISLEMAIKQAIEYNNSVEKEVIWLASHGFLHLLGWDHQDEAQLENMIKIQEYMISKLNFE
tara:strand:+ start:147 stop:695 length:549 start_codon:yes stop_codon:yes gene_type:complete